MQTALPHIKSILAIDPGLTCMGWAYAKIDLNTGDFTVHDYGLIKPTSLMKKDKIHRDIVENILLKVDIVEAEYFKLVTQFNSDYHVSESAFFHPRSPEAYATLSICIYTLAAVLFKVYKQEMSDVQDTTLETMEIRKRIIQKYTLRKLAPRQIKKAVSLDGTSDKEKIQIAIMENPRIKFIKQPETFLIEHEADAIGAAYTFAQLLPTIGISI